MLDFLNHLFNFHYFNIIYRKFIQKQLLKQKNRIRGNYYFYRIKK